MSYRAVFYDSVTGNPIWVDIDPATLPVTAASGRSMVKAQVSSGPPIQPPTTTGPQWAQGYWDSVNITPFCPPAQIEWGALTHLIHNIAIVNSDGTLNTSTLTSQGIATDVAQLKAACGNVKLVLGLSNGDYSSAITHRPAFVNNIMAIVNQYGYSGVDLDWEKGQVNVAQLGQDLRAALGQDRSLTAAAVVTGYNYWGAVQAPFDRVNVMTYSLFTTTPSVWFNSALFGPADDSVWSVDLAQKRYIAGGVPAAKLGIGIPFYGQWWPTITSHTQPAPNPTEMHYTDVQPLIASREYSFDYQARVPTISNPGLIGYDNEQSITEKIQFVKQKGLGGFILWNINTQWMPNATVKNPLMLAVKNGR